LLELELEDNPTAAQYLQDIGNGMDRMRAAIAQVSPVLHEDQGEGDPLDLTVFLRGTASRLEKMGKAKVRMDFGAAGESDPIYRGDLQLLAEAILELAAYLLSLP